jgi:hydrogenase maturation protease
MLSPDYKTCLKPSIDEHALRASLSKFLSGSWAVVGLGNPDRADDGAGLLVAQTLQARDPKRAFLETETPVESILDMLADRCDTVLFVDAADFGGRPGEIRFFQSDQLDEFQPSVSTHSLPIGFWFGYAESNGIHPILAGIQPASLAWMGGMSPNVAASSEMLGRVLSVLI